MTSVRESMNKMKFVMQISNKMHIKVYKANEIKRETNEMQYVTEASKWNEMRIKAASEKKSI